METSWGKNMRRGGRGGAAAGGQQEDDELMRMIGLMRTSSGGCKVSEDLDLLRLPSELFSTRSLAQLAFLLIGSGARTPAKCGAAK
eukprot:757254-Pyramimonas_sp.AAC.1